VRELSPTTTIETLVPDFRGRMDIALDVLGRALPDVLNHNMETVPRLYKQARPGADYAHSLELLKQFKARYPHVSDQVRPDGRPRRNRRGNPRSDARPARPRRRNADHRPVSGAVGHHLPVTRYVHPDIFKMYEAEAKKMGFTGAACAPMVRSSYWADQQAHSAGVA
jgi:lipoyl synthase